MKRRSYQRSEHDPIAITPYEAECVQQAFDYLNKRLFDGALPDVFIRYETKATSDGYYSPNGFSGRHGEFGKDAITLNADRFVGEAIGRFVPAADTNVAPPTGRWPKQSNALSIDRDRSGNRGWRERCSP